MIENAHPAGPLLSLSSARRGGRRAVRRDSAKSNPYLRSTNGCQSEKWDLFSPTRPEFLAILPTNTSKQPIGRRARLVGEKAEELVYATLLRWLPAEVKVRRLELGPDFELIGRRARAHVEVKSSASSDKKLADHVREAFAKYAHAYPNLCVVAIDWAAGRAWLYTRPEKRTRRRMTRRNLLRLMGRWGVVW